MNKSQNTHNNLAVEEFATNKFESIQKFRQKVNTLVLVISSIQKDFKKKHVWWQLIRLKKGNILTLKTDINFHTAELIRACQKETWSSSEAIEKFVFGRKASIQFWTCLSLKGYKILYNDNISVMVRVKRNSLSGVKAWRKKKGFLSPVHAKTHHHNW